MRAVSEEMRCLSLLTTECEARSAWVDAVACRILLANAFTALRARCRPTCTL